MTLATIQNAKYAVFESQILDNTKCAASYGSFLSSFRTCSPIISVIYRLMSAYHQKHGFVFTFYSRMPKIADNQFLSQSSRSIIRYSCRALGCPYCWCQRLACCRAVERWVCGLAIRRHGQQAVVT